METRNTIGVHYKKKKIETYKEIKEKSKKFLKLIRTQHQFLTD